MICAAMSTKRCAHCSKDIPQAAAHCVFCGQKQRGPAAASPPAEAKTIMGYSVQDVLAQQQLAAAGAAAGLPGAAPPAQQPGPPPAAAPRATRKGGPHVVSEITEAKTMFLSGQSPAGPAPAPPQQFG